MSLVYEDFADKITISMDNITSNIATKIEYAVGDDFALEVYNKGKEIQKKRDKEREENELEARRLVNNRLRNMIRKVTFSGDWTIIKWSDGTVTKATRRKGEKYDREKGFLVCVAKKLFNNKGSVLNEVMKKWCDD